MKRSEKGMALASTVIMMSIVLMLSTLMVTVTLYSSQVASLQTQNVEDKVVLDQIGEIIIRYKDNPDKAMEEIKTKHNLKYIDMEGNETPALELSNGKKSIRGKIAGNMNVTITLEETSSKQVFKVLSKRRTLMTLTFTRTVDVRTDNVTTTLKNWKYGD